MLMDFRIMNIRVDKIKLHIIKNSYGKLNSLSKRFVCDFAQIGVKTYSTIRRFWTPCMSSLSCGKIEKQYTSKNIEQRRNSVL